MVRISMLSVYFSILTLYINIKISMFNLIASVRFFILKKLKRNIINGNLPTTRRVREDYKELQQSHEKLKEQKKNDKQIT